MSDERVKLGETNPVNNQKHIARYNLALGAVTGKKVLDAACGTGYGTEILSWEAKEVHGVDISQEAIKHAINNHSGLNISHETNDIRNIKGGGYDVIVSFETIEHIKDTGEVFKKFDSLLNDGGIIIFSVPLNEKKGWNEHHVHTYNLAQARAISNSYQMISELLQRGITFSETDTYNPEENFVYYVAAIKK